MTDGEMRVVKEKITAFTSQIPWHLLEGWNGVLVYTDKRGVNLSRSNMIIDSLKSSLTKIE